MKQILLFGGSGFLGQSLLEQLASQDVKVYAVTRKLTDDLLQKKTKSIEWIEADL
ncbi:NAD-dependent epimerase/dehydratase family protein, partial [Streptococcus pyogenes]